MEEKCRCSSTKDLAAGEDISSTNNNMGAKACVPAKLKHDDVAEPSDGHGSGDPSTRPKVYKSATPVNELSARIARNLKLDTGAEGATAECPFQDDGTMARKCSRKDVENTFTNLYCYSNLLQSISDDNDTDHYRFLKFMDQVEHKQSELIRVSEAIPECTNLAIDLAYNCVVTASYMSLMFNSHSGKQLLVEEISQLALNTARHMLEFAHMSREQLVPDCVEELIVVMQKFCLTTVVDQVKQLPNLTHYQKRVLEKIEDIIERLEYDSEASLSTLDLDVSSDDSTLADAVKEAQDFGRDAYASASVPGKSQPAADNRNNNADDPEVSDSDSNNSNANQDVTVTDAINVNANAGDSAVTDSKTGKGDTGTTEGAISSETMSADMDDIILFTKCNPYANIWKLYIDNTDMVSLFKINNNLREACIDTLPSCFKIILWLEDMAHKTIASLITEECEMVNRTFHTLQHIISSESAVTTGNSLLAEIVSSFQDMGSRYDMLLQHCESEISRVIEEMKSGSSFSSDAEGSGDSDIENPIAEPKHDMP